MNPFDSWYSAQVAPQLEQSLKSLPAAVHAPMRQASREQMAACWNAALEAAASWYDEPDAAALMKFALGARVIQVSK